MKTMSEILRDSKWSGECGVATDKSTTHNYIDGFYEKEFFPYQDKAVRILEIGIASGHSLLLWNEYFPNHLGVYGVDNCGGKIVSEARNNEKILIKIDDAYSNRVADSLPSFDLIIDDGPHTLESMISCIKLYLPKLNPNGVFVIEDVQSISWMTDLRNTFESVKTAADECEVVDLRATKGRYDDLMFVVRRK